MIKHDKGCAPLRVLPDDPTYLRDAKAEAEFWAKLQPFSMDREGVYPPDSPFELHNNRRFTGDPHRPWFEAIGGYGPFYRGLILGTGSLDAEQRILETNPSLSVTFVDVSLGALLRRRAALLERFPGRVSFILADLNFLHLRPGTFDLVISSSTIHHVMNLEHLARVVNDALTEQGRFFLHDYVGETRFRFAPEKKRILELFGAYNARRRGRPTPLYEWHNEDDASRSPFCGARSGDIIDVFRACLTEERLRTSGAVASLLLFSKVTNSRPTTLEKLRRRLLGKPRLRFDELLLLDDVVSETGLLAPYSAFGIYAKRIDQS